MTDIPDFLEKPGNFTLFRKHAILTSPSLLDRRVVAGVAA